MSRINVDMDKARELHRENLRRARLPLLQELDGEFMRAHDIGDKSALEAIKAQKQELRDAPANPAIDAAQTPEELKAAVPDLLKGKVYK